MGSAYFDARSLWQRCEKPLYKSLTGDLTVDVCVIGAGIAGLTTAYELRKAGLSVIVLDKERIGLGETGLSSAHLASALDEGFTELERVHGALGARLARESHAFAIDRIEQIQKQEEIACDFERVAGYLFLGEKHRTRELENEKAAAERAGFTDLELLRQAPIELFQTGPALRFANQAQFHPLRYLEGLADAFTRLGGDIFTHTEARKIQGGRNTFVETARGQTIHCASVVVATNVPINNLLAVHVKNYAYRSYMIGMPIATDKAQNALLWDNADPYHYLRFAKDPATQEDLLLIGGEDHRTGQDASPEHHFAELAKWARIHLGLNERIVTRWSGQILEPVDGLAFIGRNPGDESNVFIITGDSGHGLTHGTLGATLIRDLILQNENPWTELYDPARLHMRSLRNFVRESAISAAPYGDWLASGDVPSVDDIARGEGAVVREGLRKVAAYRDETGTVHRCSAICPHLGGLVRWNGAEKTWDCPCHGSRFDRFGEVVNGPANSALPEVGDPLGTIPVLGRGPQAEI